MRTLFADIETGKLADDLLRTFYKEPSWEEFNESCDQRWKPETRQAKFEEQKANGWSNFVDKAAMSPITGQVVAYGLKSGESVTTIVGQEDGATEADLLNAFWAKYIECRKNSRTIAGWNFCGFDIPFLIRRSWANDVSVPKSLFDRTGRYLNETFVDLMKTFAAGSWQEKFISLDVAAKFLGVGGKNGDGADFARLWFGTDEERSQAKAYLDNDLVLTQGVARRIGVN